MNPLIIFLSHRDRLSRDEIQARIHARLTKEGGCRNVRYTPSRLRRRYVCADVTPTVFLEDAYPVEEAQLEIRFWKPTTASHEYYWINWIEPSREFLVGWHQDETHSDLGRCHLQIEHQNETLTREPATFIDEHPLSVLEQRLAQLSQTLSGVRWDGAFPAADSMENPKPPHARE